MGLQWPPADAVEDNLNLTSVEPESVLMDVDGPRIFTTRDRGLLYLWFFIDEAGGRERFLVTPTSERLLQQLDAGAVSVREALTLVPAWAVELDCDGEVSGCWRIPAEAISERLPEPGLTLNPEEEPLLRLRLEGAGLGPNGVPASVGRMAFDSAYSTLKNVAEYCFLDGGRGGRPLNALKRLIDLPVQRVAFSSFEVSFGKPASDDPLLAEVDEHALVELGEALSRALESAVHAHNQPSTDDEQLLLIQRLLPPRSGAVEAVSVSGSLVTGGEGRPYRFDREMASTLRKQIKRVAHEHTATVSREGYVRELDKDRQTFTLRTSEGKDIASFRFSDELFDIISDYFQDDVEVFVFARKSGGKSSTPEVIDIADRAPERDE
ncbi:hypothetical protein [Arhodomonas sp. SL1]|uniref:hypothetical protein n=1 Tax=Arhodomonas sp. SL1 TaxID=3425691 RepID=UPI003F884AEB